MSNRQLPAWAARTTRKLIPDAVVPDPPEGHVWLEWVGEASPLDSPIVQYRLLTGQYTPEQEDVIRALANRRIPRVELRLRRRLRRAAYPHGIPGLQAEEYIWGPKPRRKPGMPGSFIQAVTFKDAHTIKSSKVGHEFRIWREADGEPEALIQLQNGHISLARKEEFTSVKAFNRAMGW